MEIIIQPSAELAAGIAARLIAQLLTTKPNAVLGLATGGTPLLLYRALIEMKLDWSKVTTFNLDEYIGLSPVHPQSYHSFMWKYLFNQVNVHRKNVHIPDGMASDIRQCCDDYEKRIQDAGGIDLQLLGVGVDGHIGFNEPSSSLASRTRIKTLTEKTRRVNARFFDKKTSVPHHVITMGIGSIMEAQTCLLLAFGAKKSRALAAAVEGPVTSMNPASVLQMHPQVKVCVDRAAASRLTHADYYRAVYRNKPDWEGI
jgi:glucosamine-6-phosphate deaminase